MTKVQQVPNSQQKLYTVREAMAMVPLSRTRFYIGLNNGDIPSVRIGRKILIPAAWVAKLASLPEAAEG